MVKKTEKDFIGWLSGASIYLEDDSCSLLGGRFMCASNYDEDYSLKDWLEYISMGSPWPGDSVQEMKDKIRWITCHDDPSIAMAELVEKMRRFYFDELNGGGE